MNFRKIYSGLFRKVYQNLLREYGVLNGRGVRKEHGFVNGKYVDCYDLGLMRRDWKKK